MTGNTPLTRPENRAFYPALDGLRALAFVMVFFQHYYSLPWGWTGVTIFFVLSGFLITGILFDSRDDLHRARNFYVRRTLRIFPLYYGTFLLLLLLFPVMKWDWTRAWIAWPLYLGNFLRVASPAATIVGSPLQNAANGWLHSLRHPSIALNLGHFWSLCVEEQFYLVWPWVVFWIRSRKALLWICGVTVLLDAVLRVAANRLAPPWLIQQDLLHSFTPFALGSLLLGGLLGLLWRGPHRDRLILGGRVIAALGLLTMIVYFASVPRILHPTAWASYQYPSWYFTAGIPFANFLSAALLLCVLKPGGLLHRFFALSPLRWIGRISYSAYVLHDMFHPIFLAATQRIGTQLVLHYGNSNITRYQTQIFPIFVFAFTLALAALSFRYFESPFLNLKERWTIRNPRPHPPTSTPSPAPTSSPNT